MVEIAGNMYAVPQGEHDLENEPFAHAAIGISRLLNITYACGDRRREFDFEEASSGIKHFEEASSLGLTTYIRAAMLIDLEGEMRIAIFGLPPPNLDKRRRTTHSTLGLRPSIQSRSCDESSTKAAVRAARTAARMPR